MNTQILSQKPKTSADCVQRPSAGHTTAAWPFVSAVYVQIFWCQKKKREIAGKPQPNNCLFTPCRAVQMNKKKKKMAKWKKSEIMRGWGWNSESVRIKWACAYTSVVLLTIIWSKRNKGGKHQFSSAWWTHSCTLGGWCTAARMPLRIESTLASDVAGVGNFC